jgi:hypothetical protein
MEVKFADSFWESLDRMIKRERWYWKIWDFFRYDLPKGIKNIIFFWNVIWNFRNWDSTYNLRILARSLEPLRDSIINGMEVDGPRLKKVAKIERAIEILNNIADDKYTDIAESELGYEVDTTFTFDDDEPDEIKKANRKIYDLSREIEEKEWEELWKIFNGQQHSQYIMLLDRMTDEEKKKEDVWDKWFDGSDMRRWWN